MKKQWNNFLPPVGEEIEFTAVHRNDPNETFNDQFMKGKVDFVSSKGMVITRFDGLGQFEDNQLFIDFENYNVNFRPIKAEAEKTRYKQINDLTEKLLDCYVTVETALDPQPYREMAEKLHNSGCYVMHEVNANVVVNIWGMVSNQRGFSEAVLQDFAKAILAHAKGELV